MSSGACSTCSATLSGNTPSGTAPQSSHNLKLKSGASFAADQTSPVNIFWRLAACVWWGTEPASQTVLIYCDWDLQESLEGNTSVACPAWAGLSEAVGLRSRLTAEQCVCECVEGWAGVNLPELGQMLLTSSSQVGSLRGKMASNPPGVRAFGLTHWEPSPLRCTILSSPLSIHSRHSLIHWQHSPQTLENSHLTRFLCLYHSSGVNTSPSVSSLRHRGRFVPWCKIGP